MAIGPLGIVTDRGIGFDIDGAGTAFATISTGFPPVTSLYTVDLATGAVTAIGLVGDGTVTLPGLAVAPGGPMVNASPAAP